MQFLGGILIKDNRMEFRLGNLFPLFDNNSRNKMQFVDFFFVPLPSVIGKLQINVSNIQTFESIFRMSQSISVKALFHQCIMHIRISFFIQNI